MDICSKNRYNILYSGQICIFCSGNIDWEVPHVKYDKSVYRSLALITQFGINMLVPIFLCTIAGVYIGKKFSVEWAVIPLFVVGALAGFRNVFIMAHKIYSKESPSRGKGTRRVEPAGTARTVENAAKELECGKESDASLADSMHNRHLEKESRYAEKN